MRDFSIYDFFGKQFVCLSLHNYLSITIMYTKYVITNKAEYTVFIKKLSDLIIT